MKKTSKILLTTVLSLSAVVATTIIASKRFNVDILDKASDAVRKFKKPKRKLSQCGSYDNLSLDDEYLNDTDWNAYDDQNSYNNIALEYKDSDYNIEIEKYGCFPLKNNWTYEDKHSTPEKEFFVKEGSQDQSQPDNISIQMVLASNADENFAHIIADKLASNIDGIDDENIQSSNTVTNDGDQMYIFTIKDDTCVTTQYFILGEAGYVLIHATNFSNSEELDDVAKVMAYGFKWFENLYA